MARILVIDDAIAHLGRAACAALEATLAEEGTPGPAAHTTERNLP